ncbi:MAG TPA: aldo/keto reductase [Thermomicrobiales bacterium]|nr:aldo/keto reductase [Thermomicrobiales bacterium]
MELRRLGNSGLLVSAIGLGGNTFGATVDGADAVRVIQGAIDAGITFLDTADVYSQGRSEELVGQAIAGRRDKIVLATKCGMAMGESPYTRGLSRRWIMQAVENSLRRLNTDYIDLYQAHRPDPETPTEETLRAMDDLVRQGKVRYIGCSNFAAWQVAHDLGVSTRERLVPWISAQNRFNLLDGLSDPELLSASSALGVGIIPYTPLASGILTGKYGQGEPPAGTRLGDLPAVRQRLTAEKQAAVERLRPWADAHGHTTSELAIAWLLAHPEVSTVIAGARSLDQVRANIRAADWTLPRDEREAATAVARGMTA